MKRLLLSIKKTSYCAIENISELFGYLATGRVNIRDIEGKMGSVRREVSNGMLPLLDVG